MTKANQTVATVAQANPFAGLSAKEVRIRAQAGQIPMADAIAYASRKAAELAGHKFRGQLWAQTVQALTGAKPANAGKRKSAPAAAPTKAEILAQIQALTAALSNAK